MLINKQSNKGYLKISQTSIGSRKVEGKKKEERENKNERQGWRELFSLEMQIHWNEFRRDVRLSQYSMRRKEKSIIAVCFTSFFSISPSSFFFSPFFKFTLGIASSLSLLTHRERIFRVNFLAAPSDIPRTGIYIFVGPLTSPSLLSFTPSTLVSFLLSISFCPSHRSTRLKRKKTQQISYY